MDRASRAPVIDIGIDEADRIAIAEGLSRLLADSYTLYLKTHNYHWNVVGPMFNTARSPQARKRRGCTTMGS